MIQEKKKKKAATGTKKRKEEKTTPNQPEEVMSIRGCEIRLNFASKTEERTLLDIEAILHKNFTL